MNFPITTPSEAEIMESLQKEVSKLVGGAKSAAHPVFIHTLGIPGSGKTSFARALDSKLSNAENPSMMVNFDRIMESMPEYKAEKDAVKAFGLFEAPARAAGYLLLKKLLEKRANVLLDHSGSRQDHVEILKCAKQLGYKIVVVLLVADRETVKERISKRQRIEGRFTPLNYVDERDEIIKGLLRQYKEITDCFFEINSAGYSGDFTLKLEESCDDIVKSYEMMR